MIHITSTEQDKECSNFNIQQIMHTPTQVTNINDYIAKYTHTHTHTHTDHTVILPTK